MSEAGEAVIPLDDPPNASNEAAIPPNELQTVSKTSCLPPSDLNMSMNPVRTLHEDTVSAAVAPRRSTRSRTPSTRGRSRQTATGIRAKRRASEAFSDGEIQESGKSPTVPTSTAAEGLPDGESIPDNLNFVSLSIRLIDTGLTAY